MVSYTEQLDILQARLRDLAVSMKAAQAKGDTEALAAFRVQYRAISQQAAAIRQAISTGEAPSTLLLRLDAFSDNLIAVGKSIGEDVGSGLQGAATTLKLLPVLLVLGLVVLGIGLYRGSLSLKRGG